MATRQNNAERSTYSSVICSAIMCVVALALMCGISACTKKQVASERERAQQEAAQTQEQQQETAQSQKQQQEAPNKEEAGSGKLDETVVNQKLAEKWTEDFTRIADASKMQACVSAVDLNTGTTVTHQADQKMPSASMIKVLIAETFLKQVDEGKHSLDENYTLKAADIVGGTGSLGGRGAGAQVSCREMVQKMIAESDNVATNALIDLCGMDNVNKEAKRLGLKNTELGRHMMDTAAAEAGHENYTSADDLAVLFKMVYDQTFVNKQMSTFMLECLEAQQDKEGISQGLPAEAMFAHKTGALAMVRHDGGIVEGDKPFVIVVMCGGDGYNEAGALQTMAEMGKAAYEDVHAS